MPRPSLVVKSIFCVTVCLALTGLVGIHPEEHAVKTDEVDVWWSRHHGSIKFTDVPVIIIGAGVSGLAAAQKLVRHNIPVIILEGRDRLGGRIWTVQPIHNRNATVDMGAMWVDGGPNHNLVYPMAEQKASLKLVHAPYIENPLEIGRQHRAYDQANQQWTSWWRINWYVFRVALLISNNKLTASSKGDNMQEKLQEIYRQNTWFFTPNRYDRFVLETPLTLMNAAPLDKLHPQAENSEYFHIHDAYDEGSPYRIVGGYQKLVEHLRHGIPNTSFQMNQTVTSIEVQSTSTSSAAVQVHAKDTSSGKTHSYEGSRVIVTVPLGVLKQENIHFDPPLPQAKHNAITRLGFGNLEKVAMTFEQPFWRSDPKRIQNVYYVASDSSKIEAGFPIFVDVTDTVPVLVAVASTEAAQRHVREGSALPILQNMLQEMFPESNTSPTSKTSTHWKTDPFSVGSYSCLLASTRPGDIEALAEPYGNIRFAGEATSYLQAPPGYVEGAILTGWREADRILEELQS